MVMMAIPVRIQRTRVEPDAGLRPRLMPATNVDAAQCDRIMTLLEDAYDDARFGNGMPSGMAARIRAAWGLTLNLRDSLEGV